MLFLAECIRIFTTWQAIPFKRKFYYLLVCSFSLICISHCRNQLKTDERESPQEV